MGRNATWVTICSWVVTISVEGAARHTRRSSAMINTTSIVLASNQASYITGAILPGSWQTHPMTLNIYHKCRNSDFW